MNTNQDLDKEDVEAQPLLLTDRQVQQLSSKIFHNQDPSEWVRRQLNNILTSQAQASDSAGLGLEHNNRGTHSIVTGTFNTNNDIGITPDDDNDNANGVDDIPLSHNDYDDSKDDSPLLSIGMGNGDGGKGTGYMKTSGAKRIKALEAANHNLQAQVHALEEKVAAMEADMNRMKASSSPLDSSCSGDDQSAIEQHSHDNGSGAAIASTSKKMRGSFFFRNLSNSNGNKRGLDEDTFSLMMISPASLNSPGWFLGLIACAFQIILGTMIAKDQISEGVGSSIFNIPFRVDPVVRVGQFLTIILCISTQSDVLSAIQCFILMQRKSENWQTFIGMSIAAEGGGGGVMQSTRMSQICASCGCGASSWFVRIAVPNSLKILQGLLVIVVSFVIIVQSSNIIDLLKDFTALMVLSETDNILFQLADMGYLGKHLQCMAAQVREIEMEDGDGGEDDAVMNASSTTPINDHGPVLASSSRAVTFANGDEVHHFPPPSNPHNENRISSSKESRAFYTRSIGLFAMFAILLGWWIRIVIGQENGEFFKMRYPNCTSEDDNDQEESSYKMFLLAKKHFGDGMCYGGPLNTLGCKFEGGDCIDFNLAYPLCKGNDLIDLEKEVGNGTCNDLFATSECDFDGGDCCPHEITKSAQFGDGQCNGGKISTKRCGYDGGDCKALVREFPNCPFDEISQLNDSSDVILGNGICEGVSYVSELCGREYRDCDVGQIGQDVTFRGVFSGNDFQFKSRLSADGSKLMIGMSKTDAHDEGFNANARGKVKMLQLDARGEKWIDFGDDLVGDNPGDLYGYSIAMSADGSHIAVGAPYHANWFGMVKVFFFNVYQNKWVQLGQDFKVMDRASFRGASIDMTEDASRIAISSPILSKIQIYEMNWAEEIWIQVGKDINAKEESRRDIMIGFFYVKLSSDGSRVYFSKEYYDNDKVGLRAYEYNAPADKWTQLGHDIPTPQIQTFQQPGISADGNRIAISSYTSSTALRYGQVQVFDLQTHNNVTAWTPLGPPIVSEEKKEGDGFGYSLDMSSDGTLLAIASLDRRCVGSPEWCPTGSVNLYRYDPKNPPHRHFSRVPLKRVADSAHVMQKAERNNDKSIFGWDISLSKDGSRISVSGYDLINDSGFVKVYEVDEIFYPDCVVSNPEEIGNGFCSGFEPYYTAQCSFDGLDCQRPSPVDGFPECFVWKPEWVGNGACIDYFPYNSKECGYDGKDCKEPVQVEGYPECYVTNPGEIGDGECTDRLPYNGIKCGFDGGDCLPEEFKNRSTTVADNP